MKRSYSRRELYALGEPLGDSATYRKAGGLVLGDGGGGGGSSAPSTQTTTAELPEWARPYAKDTLAKGAALTDINQNPYQTYGGNRIAGFTPMQQQSFQGAANMQPSQQLGTATDLAAAAGLGALGTNYQAGQFSNQFQDPGQYQPGQFSMSQVQGPDLQNYQMQGPQDVQAQGYNAPTMQGAQTDYNPNLQNFQMGPAERVRTQSFAQPGSAEAYMSPYMQNVVDIQKREAQRQSGIQGTQQQAQAVSAGAFGGSRDAIMRAERERNLGQQMGDIQATGSQAAYQQAQQQFNAEQQARLQAQQANQQAGLTVGGQNLAARLGVQQLGTQTGLQTSLANLNNQQQAAVQNQAAQLQTQGLNAQQAMQAALANQQAGLTVGSQNLAANLGVQQLGAGQNLQSQLANQQAFQQAQNAAEQSRQFGAGQGLQAAGLSAQYGQAAQQMGEQSRQYGAGLGMQGLQTALQGAGQLGQLGGQQFQQGMDINKLQSAYGGQMQQQAQRPLDMAYQDFLNQQNYPYKQLGFMSDMIRGLPLGQQSTSSIYEQGPGMTQTLAGLGGAAYGFGKSGLFGKEGGLMTSYAGGGVTSQANKDSIVEDMYSMEGLQKAKEAALARRDADTAEAIDERIAQLNALQAQNASIDRGLGSAFDQIPPEQQETMMAANGGIVAFAGGGSYLDKAEEARKQQLSYIDKATAQQTPEEQKTNILAQRDVMKDLYGPSVVPKYLEEVKAERAALPEKMESERGLAFAMASLGLLARKKTKGESQSQQLISGLGEAGQTFAGEVGRLKKEHREADRLLRQSEMQLATADQLYNNGMTDKAVAKADQAQAAKAKAAELYAGVAGDTSKMYAQLENTKLGKEASIEAARIQAGASERSAKIAATKETDLARQTRIRYESLIEQGKPANKQTMAEAAAMAASDVGRYPGEAKAAAAVGERDAKFEARVDKALESNMPYLKAVQKGNTEEAARIRQSVIAELRASASQAEPQPAPNVPGGTGTPSRGGPPQKLTQAQYNAAPSGTRFIAPDGTTRIKP